MIVYHGSYMHIEEIDLKRCKPHKDFGRGFYVTNIRTQAERWASRIAKEHDAQPVISEFDFDEYAFEDDDMKTLRFNNYNKEWLDFVVFNRQRRSPMHTYDIVEGPVADDDITTRVDAYIDGRISTEDFIEELKFKEGSHQIAFCTLRSLQMLEKITKWEYIGNIDDDITQTLVSDYNMSREKAIDVYFDSKVYAKLIEENSDLLNLPNEEIFNLLLKELGLKKK